MKHKKAKPKLAEKPVLTCRYCERICYSKYEFKRHVCKGFSNVRN